MAKSELMDFWIKRYVGLLFLALVFVAGAGSVQAEEALTEGQATFNFVDVDIRSVVKSVAKITGKNFILDPAVKGKVTIISSQPIEEEDVYGLFLSVLQVHDLAALESGDIVKIVQIDRAKQEMDSFETGDRLRRPEDRQVTSIIKLEHVPADRVVAILRPLVPAKSYLAAHPDSNIIIISDRAGNVNRLMEMIRKIDLPEAGEIEVVKLQNAAARDVVAVIEGLEAKAGKPQPGADLKLIADDRTNSVLVSGSEQYRSRIKSLISHLDSPIKAEGDTQVIFLRFAKAKELVPILSGIDVAEKSQVPQGAAGAAAMAGGKDVMIQADEATNALIISASPSTMQSLLNVVRKLDIRRVQVMIEAVIAEISTDRAADLGVQWRSTSSPDGGGIIGGTDFPNSGEIVRGGITAVSINPVDAGPGFNIGYFNGTATILGTEVLNLGGLVSALSSDADTNILSTPTLVTLDNEEAEIIVGENVPFATGSYTSTGNTTPTNPFTTYERQDVGVKLKVKPQITEGKVVRLDITQETSKVKTTTTVGLQTTDTRLIKTAVMVEDGKILVLGGLISEDVQEKVLKVPVLGDIPFLGVLFRYKYTTKKKKNLMVFLRPAIMRDEATSSRITFDKYDYMRRLQMSANEEGINLMPGATGPQLPEISPPDQTPPQIREQEEVFEESSADPEEVATEHPEEIAESKKEAAPPVIFDIDVQKNAAETTVHIIASGSLENYRTNTLEKIDNLPDRLYIDFPAATMDVSSSQLEVKTTLARIRSAQRENGVRVVFDSGIDQLFDYKLHPEPDGFMIVIPEAGTPEIKD